MVIAKKRRKKKERKEERKKKKKERKKEEKRLDTNKTVRLKCLIINLKLKYLKKWPVRVQNRFGR